MDVAGQLLRHKRPGDRSVSAVLASGEGGDGPATLEVVYPAHLSRGLVLVKSWLHAIPQLVIVGLFTSGAVVNRGHGRRGGIGLLGSPCPHRRGLVALHTALPARSVRLRHGCGIGGCYRVVAYVALMTDEYPPFRLDQGGADVARRAAALRAGRRPGGERRAGARRRRGSGRQAGSSLIVVGSIAGADLPRPARGRDRRDRRRPDAAQRGRLPHVAQPRFRHGHVRARVRHRSMSAPRCRSG